MSHFNEEQLKELECIFGLTRVVTINTLPVRDGIVTKEDIVWWRCDEGAKQVKAKDHWYNIKGWPSGYQRKQPVVKLVIYEE